jgi:DNA-binding MarR family transcriptional regulator
MTSRPDTASSSLSASSEQDAALLEELYRRPGFLIRRAHQIGVSLFLEEAAPLGITTTQYGALFVLSVRHRLDQVGLAQLVGIDRSTTALVVGKLEEAGYIKREEDPADGRRKLLVLTEQGQQALDALAEPARRSQERALAPFTAKQRETFLRLLERFVNAFNEDTRAPIRTADAKRARKKSPASRSNGKTKA